MGCDDFSDVYYGMTFVSIHAPTWGATFLGVLPTPQFGVSIHAPTWGATRGTELGDLRISVSIHAPTWGATHVLLASAT